ncbi:MAG: H/ACA ribonucleoprotein complex subunit GAR1, partial [Candidatus Hodarchaeota archaeon]
MKELGVTPKHFTTEMAVLLLDPHKLPPLYAPVILKNRKKVGTITDIIGPVKSPWCVVKLKKQYITL